MNEVADRETGSGAGMGVWRRERDKKMLFLSLSLCLEATTQINAQQLERILCQAVSGRLNMQLLGRPIWRSHNCGGGVSLSLSAKSGIIDLDVVSVPSSPQREVLNPRVCEYPPW